MFSVLKKISDFAGTRRGLLKKSMAVAFLGAVFAALQFAALMLTLDILVGGADLRIWPVIGVMVVSVVGRAACSYWSTNAETETGYFMVAEKRIHIGDRLRYIPMGYFNDNSLGNITAVVTTTLSDVENNAARCLVSVIGGFLNTLGLCLGLTVADWRLGLLAIAGIIRGENCSVYKMENETGEGVITRYPVFPGIELLYDDIHMSCGVAHREDPRADLLEINHCRTGRFECEFSDGRAVYLGEGDLAVNVMTNRTRETWFPLSHYHGITIAVDIPVADRVLRQVSEALGEGLYCDLFAMRDRLCAHNSCFVMRAADSIQHIFSELYHAPEDLRAGYFKLKVMELFLFLGSPEITAQGEDRLYVDRSQAEQIKSVRQYLIEHLDRRITLQTLSQTFSFPLTSMKKCFKEVYGTTINAYLQAYRMHTAAGLLRETRLDVTEIAGKVGYQNASKFSEVFRQHTGHTPTEYRKTFCLIGADSVLREWRDK